MSHRIITVSRKTGSGGTEIAQRAAKKLGIPCYGQELIEKIAEESGMLKEYVQENSENVKGGWLSITAGRDFYGHSLQDELHNVQTRVIRELAEKESCIIIGRCSDYILRDHDNLLTVFIHASMERRVERMVERYGSLEGDPAQRLKEIDRRRKAYYQLYTDRSWGAVDNYHITLDSGVLGIGRCADLIAKLY